MTAEAKQAMEKQILQAAEELFLEKGFALTSTTAIAKKVGCNQALVHYYFRTKDRLIEAVLKEKLVLFLSSFMKIDKESTNFEERLKRKAEAHFDILAANPRLPFLLFNEISGNSARIPFIKKMVAELPTQVFAEFSRQLKDEIEAGRVRPLAPVDVVLTLISLNVALFLAQPLLMNVFAMSEQQFKAFIQHRKSENVAIILRSLKP